MALSTNINNLLEGKFINDCYGSLTQTAGTVITRVVPPAEGLRACVGSFRYEAAATAHSLTMMVAVDEVEVSSEAASGQAVVNMNRVPTAGDGSVIANTDFFIIQYEDGSWAVHKVSSASGKAITMTANLSQAVLKGAKAFFMGAPGDHTDRIWTMKASTITVFDASDFRIRAASGSYLNSPILVHSDNATNAGTLYYLSYYYDGE